MQPILQDKTLEKVVIRFAGDSGDGMQLTGNQFTGTSALFGNDVATLPDFPAEIRAPAGTVAGVSGFQIQIGNTKVNTPGDYSDILVAMNPAALKANIQEVVHHGTILVDEGSFTEKNLEKAGYTKDPFSKEEIGNRKLLKMPITSQTLEALKEFDLPKRTKEKCKNFFTLGVIFWLYDRKLDYTTHWLKKKFAKKPEIAKANIQALNEGMNYAENCGLFQSNYHVEPAKLEPGIYRNLTGNVATSLGLITATQQMQLELFFGSYPITPASDILHELSAYKNYRVKTFQAEDEIAAISSAIGASFAGALGVTSTSGPGMALKTEAIGLAVMAELPVVIINVQRGGPSTGLPTKTEQADLLQAMYARNGECPVPILAAKSPADCFDQIIEATRIAVKFMTPVIFLSDGYLANGSEPFKIPNVEQFNIEPIVFPEKIEHFETYQRDEQTLARTWVKPGTVGLTHRIGGLEKEENTGNISYDPENHQRMVYLRKEKVQRVAEFYPALEIFGEEKGDFLLLGWGSTYGVIRNVTQYYQKQGKSISQVHLNLIHPFPKNLKNILQNFKKIIIPEMNTGQLNMLIKATYDIKTIPINKIQGKPFREEEIFEVMNKLF